LTITLCEHLISWFSCLLRFLGSLTIVSLHQHAYIKKAKDREMGDRHNRKRTRNRPLRRQRLCQQLDNTMNDTPPINISLSTLTPFQHPSPHVCSCWRPCTRQPPQSKPISHQPLPPRCTADININTHPACTRPSTSLAPETLQSRTRRVFGGIESVDEDDLAELCAPMLDVVLSLFGGIDYDDDDDGVA
jgi:hypothetical protein